MDVVGQGFCASGLERFDAIGQHGAQDVDHLPITAGLTLQFALNAADRDRQFPILERRPVAKGAGLAGQNRYVMQGIVDGVVAPEDTRMAIDNLTVLPAFETISIGPDLDRPPDGAGVYRIAVLVEAHETGLGHRCRNSVEPVKRADIRNQALALFFEHLPDRLVPHLRMCIRPGIGQAAIFQPGVQLGIGIELGPWHKEPPPDHADLVLDLAFLPDRRRRTGDRIDQVVSAHLLEPSIVGAILADKDRVHRCLHVVVNPSRTGAAEERKCLVVRIEHHLLGLARIGSHERHPAVAETDMGDLHRRRHAIDQNDLVTPVELVSLARIEAQRNIGAGRRFLRRLRPPGRVAPHRIITAAVAAVAQLLVDADERQTFPPRPARILG